MFLLYFVRLLLILFFCFLKPPQQLLLLFTCLTIYVRIFKFKISYGDD